MAATESITPVAVDVTDVMLRRELNASGIGDREIARRVRAGDWVRIRRGAYVSTARWRALRPPQRHSLLARAVIRQAQTRVVLSHETAAVEFGAPTFGLDLSEVQVTRPDQRAGRIEAGVHQHQGRLEPDDVVERGGVEVTSPTKTSLDIVARTDLVGALCVTNFFLHEGLTDLASLWARAKAMAHDPYTLRMHLVLRLADPRIESPGETRLFHLCWLFGLPLPIPQYEIRDRRDRVVARVDFAWPELGVFVEFDGRVKYTDLVPHGQSAADVVIAEKRREDAIRELTGWRCVRVCWEDLARPADLVVRLRSLLDVARTAS